MDLENIFKLLQGFQKKTEDELKKLPYHMNIIDELHANENAHTRILIKLLQYERENKKPILESFLSMFSDITDFISIDSLGNPDVYFNRWNIDGLIIEKKKNYAVIIENKINWAIDQELQLERYIKKVNELGIAYDHIVVIYLTSNGYKEVSSYSFTDDAKKWLGYVSAEESGRFLLMNYKEDILPWLKEKVLPNCIFQEKGLISAIFQYVDYLEGLFNLRKDKASMQEELKTYLKKQLDLSSSATDEDHAEINKHLKLLNDYTNVLDEVRRDLLEKNPWSPHVEDLFAPWMATKINKYYDSNDHSPFSKVWIWHSTVCVLDDLKLDEKTFAIDISCENDGTISVQFFVRNLPPDLCTKYFEEILKNEKFELISWRYCKNVEVCNDEELTGFFEELDRFLKQLNDAVKR